MVYGEDTSDSDTHKGKKKQTYAVITFQSAFGDQRKKKISLKEIL